MKKFCIAMFILEAVLLAITIYQCIVQGGSYVRSFQSLLLLAAFAKTEYDFIQVTVPKEVSKS